MRDLEKLIDFFIEVESLKKTFRYSTCPKGVRDSSADHSWKLAFMAFVLDEEIKGVDPYHVVKICLTHDLAEYATGDVDSYRIVLGEITSEEKYLSEEKAMKDIRERFPGFEKRVYNLWREYEDGRTPESKFARALDKIESVIHLLSIGYIAREDDLEAELTARYADKAVKEFPQMKRILGIVKRRLKKEFKRQGFKWRSRYDR